MVNAYFIINPRSQTGKGKRIWTQEIKPWLEEHQYRYKAFLTHYSGHCTQIVRQLCEYAKKPLTLIILGGDGTLNEAVNGLYNTEQVTLAYIPTGSSNDFARAYLPRRCAPVERLKSILDEKHEAWLDCGVVKAPGKKPKRFIVSSGIGYDAYITDEALHSKIKNVLNFIHLGKLTYMLIAIDKLLRIQPQTVSITLDGSRFFHLDKLYFAASHNLPYEGGGFKFAPKAVPDDGQLDLCIVHGISKPGLACKLLFAFKGKHVRFKGIENIRYKHMKLVLEHPYAVHTDGETYHPRKEIEVWCEAGKIHFIY